MNVTFLLGNGFDINLGLKTKYTDFYQEYIASNAHRSKDNSIKKFCDMIGEDYETWADFEYAFANKIFGKRNDVSDILHDFSNKFAEHLKKQTELCDYTDENIPAKFKEFLTIGYLNLKGRDRQIIADKYNNEKGDIHINFINFNYTDTLDKLIKAYAKSNVNSDREHIDTVLNIHGSLDRYIVIGIDSIEQLKDFNLRNDASVSIYCVKSKMNEYAGNEDWESRFIDIINSSNIIYTYGVSFGESDKSKWRIVNNWLRTNAENKLIVYKYGANLYESAYYPTFRDAVENAKNEYLRLLGFDEGKYKRYYNQIFVIDSSDVLDIKLIKDAK